MTTYPFSSNPASVSTRVAESVQKGEPACIEPETMRTISGPSGLGLLPNHEVIGQEKRQSIHKTSTDVVAHREFQRLCDEIMKELMQIDAFIVNDQLIDESVEVVAEIESLLEELYDCRFGQAEALKRVVVAVQSQVNNTRWSKRHVDFLRSVLRFLRVRYVVDEATVGACYDMIKEHGFDPFRGTICEPSVVKRYRLEEVGVNDTKPINTTS